MHFINSSDWNSQAAFEDPKGLGVALDAHLRGYADGVSIQSVAGPEGNELLVLFEAEAGHTGAALRVKDLLLAAMRHQPELWQEVLAIGAAERGEAPEPVAEKRSFYDMDS